MSTKSQLIPEEKLTKVLSFDDAKAMLDSFNESVIYGGESIEDYFGRYPEYKGYLESYVTTTEQQNQSVQGLIRTTQEARSEQLKHNEAIKAQTLSARAGSVAMRALATAGNMLLMWGISKGIELVVTGIDNLVHSAEHCKERVNELMSSYKSALDTANNNAKTVEGFASRYKELAGGVNGFGRNLSLTTEEYKEYNNIVNQIADMFPDMVRGYTSEGNAILSLKGNVIQLREAYKAAQKEAYNLLIASGENGDGNDIIKNWENLHETSIAAKLFDFGFEDMGGKLSTKEAIDQLDAFSGMSADRYREVKHYTMYEYDSKKSESLSDIEKEIGYGTYLYKALGIDEASTDEELAEAKRRARALVLTYQAEIDAALNDMHLLANAYLMTSDDYEKMDEQSQNIASMIVNGFGEDIANGFEGKADVAAYVTDVISMIKDDPDMQNALNGLLTTNFSTLSEEEAKALVKDYVDTIKNSANGDLIDLNKLLGFSELEDGDLLTLDDFVDKLRKIQDTASIETPYKSALDNVQSLSDKLGTLKDIYGNIQSEEEFNWSSILNNKEFENAFKDAGDVYDDFIRTVTQNSNDIDACQNAFDKLSTAILYNSNIFDDLTEETRNATIAMLEQNGVMNAAELVNARLSAQNEYLALTEDDVASAGKNLSDVTWEEIAALLMEKNVSAETTSCLAQLALTKMDVNSIKLNTQDDINQIVAIANAAGTSASYIQALGNALISLKNMEFNINTMGGKTGDIIRNGQISMMEAALKTSITSQINSVKLDPAQFYGKSSGSYGGSGGSGGGASEAAKETVETFDWVENKMDSMERRVKQLDQTVGQAYKGWSERNTALTQEMEAVCGKFWTEIFAVQKYMQMADASGLSDHYKNLVKNGDIAIEDISDETLKEQISTYEKWYEKAKKCEEELEELKDTLAELVKTRFDNLTKEFENSLSVMEHAMDMINSLIDQTEKQGRLVGTAYYEELIKAEERHISMLRKEYDALSDSFANAVKDGNIEKYSEDWYDMYNSILDVDKAITEATTSLYEHPNALRELKWEYFETQQTYVSRLTEEADWLIGLLEKQGSFVETGDSIFAGSQRRTKYGTAAEGLHALNYNVYMAQADDYAKEILKINELLAKDPYNTTLIEKRNELLEAQRENIDAAYDEIDAVKDLMSEGYDAYLDKLQELIDKRKEALSAERDLYDYQKSIAEKTANIASLEKQMNAYAGDDSEESAAKIQQLKLELDEARTDLEETEYEKWISDQERLMDDLYTEYELLFNQRLDDIEFVLESMKETANNNADEINKTLTDATSAVGTTLSEEMKNIWKAGGGANTIVSQYGTPLTAGLTSVQQTLDVIKNLVASMVTDAQQKATNNITTQTAKQEAAANKTVTPAKQETNTSNNAVLKTSSGQTDTSFFVSKKDDYPKNKLNIETSIVDRLKYHDYDSSFGQMARYFAAMGFSGTYRGTASQNVQMLNWMKSHGLSRGGEIGNLIDQTGDTGFALVKTGETVITNKATQDLKDTLRLLEHLGLRRMGQAIYPDMQRKVRQTQEQLRWALAGSQHTQNNNGSVTVEIDNLTLPNVKNYDEFKTALLSDSHFEKVMGQAMADQMLGGNSLNKFRYI